MKKELGKLLLIKLKADLAQMYLDFYCEMRNDLPLEEADYIGHFGNLGETLFKIDSCDSVEKLEWAWSVGDLDLVGESFQEYVWTAIKNLEK